MCPQAPGETLAGAGERDSVYFSHDSLSVGSSILPSPLALIPLVRKVKLRGVKGLDEGHHYQKNYGYVGNLIPDLVNFHLGNFSLCYAVS